MPPRLSTSPVPALDSGWLALAWIVGTPTAFSLIDSILNLPVVTPARVVAVVVAGALAVDALRHGRRTPDPVGAWMLAFLGVMTAALAVTTIQSSAATLRADVVLLVEGYGMPFVAYKAGRRVLVDEARLAGLAWGVAITGVYLAITGFLQYTLGWQFVPDRIDIVHPLRLVGPFGNGVYYASVTSLALLTTLFLWTVVTRPAARRTVVVAAAAMLAAVVLAKGRAPWLGLMLALAFLVWRRRDLLRPLVVAGLAAAVTVPLLSIRPPAEISAAEAQVEQAVEEEATLAARVVASGPVENRIAMAAITANIAVRHPIVGLGFGTEVFESHKYAFLPANLGIPREWADWPTVPHNEFFFVLVSAGLAGLVPLVGLHVAIWRRMAARDRRSGTASDTGGSHRAVLARVVRGAQIVVLVNALFADLVFFSYLLMLFFFLVGVAESGDRHAPAPAASPQS